MGIAKRWLDQREALDEEAERALLDANAAERCDVHPDVLLSNLDDEALEQAIILARRRVANGHARLPKTITTTDIESRVRDLFAQAPCECAICAAALSD